MRRENVKDWVRVADSLVVSVSEMKAAARRVDRDRWTLKAASHSE